MGSASSSRVCKCRTTLGKTNGCNNKVFNIKDKHFLSWGDSSRSINEALYKSKHYDSQYLVFGRSAGEENRGNNTRPHVDGVNRGRDFEKA